MIETLESKSPLFRGSLSAHIINLRTFIVFIATFLGWRSNFDIGWGRGGGGGVGTTSTRHLFLLTLYNSKNIGGRTPCSAVSAFLDCAFEQYT